MATPRDALAKLSAAAVQALRAPDVAARLSAQGAEPIGNTPAEFAAFVRAEIDKWANLVKVANMKPE